MCTEILQQQQLEEAAAKNLEIEAILLAKTRETQSVQETLAQERTVHGQKLAELQSLQQRLTEERAISNQQQSELQTLRQSLSERQAELQSLSEALSKERAELKSLQHSLGQERATNSQRQEETQSLQRILLEKRATHSQQQAELQSREQSLAEERTMHSQRLAELQSRQQSLADERTTDNQRLAESLHQSLSEQQAEVQSLQQTLTNERAAHGQLQAELLSLQQTLTNERAAHVQRLAELERQVRQLEILLAQRDETRLEQEQHVASELAETRGSLQFATQSGLEWQARILTLEKELAQARAELSASVARDSNEAGRKHGAEQHLQNEIALLQAENQALLSAKTCIEAELARMTIKEAEARRLADQLRASFEEDRKALQAAQTSIIEQQREAHVHIGELEVRVVEMAANIATLKQEHQAALENHQQELSDVKLQLQTALDRQSESALRVQSLLHELDEHHKSAEAMLLELSQSADDAQRQIARLQTEIEEATRERRLREQLAANQEASVSSLLQLQQKLEQEKAAACEREVEAQRRIEILLEDLNARDAAIKAHEEMFEHQRFVWRESISSLDAQCTEQSMVITKLYEENAGQQERLASQEVLVSQLRSQSTEQGKVVSEQGKLVDELRAELRLQQSLLTSDAPIAQQHAVRFQQQCAEQSAIIVQLQGQLRQRDSELSAKTSDAQKQTSLLEDQRARQATVIAELQEQAVSHLQQLSQQEERIADLLMQQSEQLALVTSLKEESRTQATLLSSDGNQAQQHIFQLKCQCDQQAESITCLQQEAIRYQERIRSQQEQLTSMQDQLAKLQQGQSVDVNSARLELHQQHQEQLQNLDQQHQQTVFALRQKLADLEARESEAQARTTSLLTDLNHSQHTLQTLRTEAALIDSLSKADVARLQKLSSQQESRIVVQASEIATLKEELAKLQGAATIGRSDGSTTSELEALKQELTSSRTRESQLQLKINTLQQEAADAQRKLWPVQANSSNPVDSQQLQIATSELAVLKRRLERQEAQQRELVSREVAVAKQPLEQRIGTLTRKEAEAQARIARLVAELEDSHRELSRERSSPAQAPTLPTTPVQDEGRVAQLQAELLAKDEELGAMKQQMAALRQENVEQQTAIGSHLEQHEKASSWQARCQTATRELKTLRTVVSSLEQQVTSHSQREVELEAQCSLLNVSVHELREQLSAAEALAASAAAALARSAKEVSVGDGQLSVAAATRMNSCASHASSLEALEAVRHTKKRSSATGFKVNSFVSLVDPVCFHVGLVQVDVSLYQGCVVDFKRVICLF
jgi:chromosome segregation ATPase